MFSSAPQITRTNYRKNSNSNPGQQIVHQRGWSFSQNHCSAEIKVDFELSVRRTTVGGEIWTMKISKYAKVTKKRKQKVGCISFNF